MALTVNLYSLSKVTNSTAQPSGGTTALCNLKDDCSVIRPVIEVQGVSSPFSYNYAKVGAFGNRYYFIDDWSYYRGVWTAHMSVDVMATYKTTIGASTQWIARSAKASLWNKYLLDTQYMTVGKPSIVKGETIAYPDVNPFVTDIRSGCYVLGITNNDNNSVYGGTISYYVTTIDYLNMLKAYLMEFNNWSGIDSTMQAVQKFEFNPLQYISSVNYFPISYSDMPRLHDDLTPPAVVELGYVPMGWWQTPAITQGGVPFKMWALGNKPIGTLNGSFKIPKHPDFASRGNYLNLDPYARYTLVFRPFGEIALDSTYLVESSDLYYTIKFDCITGEAVLDLFNSLTAKSNETPFMSVRSCVATPVQLSQITQDVIGATQGVVNMISSGISGILGTGAQWTEMGGAVGSAGMTRGNIAGPISSIIDGTIQACRATIPQMTSVGNTGTYVEYDYTPHVFGQFFPITASASDRVGHPCYQYTTVSSSEGFTLCKDVKVPIAGTPEEMETIKQYMEAGFYYE